MRFDISPNIANGTYTALELLVIVLISRFLTTILECWNVQRTYDAKLKPRLTTSVFELLSNHGASTKLAHTIALCLVTAVIALTTAGELAISGVTETDFRDMQVRNLVRAAQQNNRLDFSKHISFDDHRVSGSVILLKSSWYCESFTDGHSRVHEFFHDLEDVTTPKWDPSQHIHNTTCLVLGNNFEQKLPTISLKLENFNISFERDCGWKVDIDNIPLRKLTKAEAITGTQCPVNILETWCFRSFGLSCIGLAQYKDMFIFSTFQRGHPGWYLTYSQFDLEGPLDSSILQSMAMLLEVGVSIHPWRLLLTVQLNLERDATVKRIVGSRDETKVNVVLLTSTLGPALLLTTITGFIALFAWVNVLAIPRRLKVNRFNSPMDLLSHAAGMKFGKSEFSHSRHRAIWFGVHSSQPIVGPIEKADATEEANSCPEGELVGRYKSF